MRNGFWWLAAWLLLLVASGSAQEESPVVSSRWTADGYEETSVAQAEFWVTATWVVPQAIGGSKTCYFKRAWRKSEEHADGSLTELIEGGPGMSGVCSDGPGGGSTVSVVIRADDNGPKVDLSLSWQVRKRSGQVEKHFSLPWSELKRTVREKDAKIYLDVFWPKKVGTALRAGP